MDSSTVISDQYRRTIDDEHHYRKIFQSRLSYHTGVVIALVGITGAGLFRADFWYHYSILSLSSFLFAYVSQNARVSVRRIYEHLIETIRAREKIEIILGLRDESDKPGGQSVDTSKRPNSENYYWPYSPIYRKTWTRDRGDYTPHKGGYYQRVSTMLTTITVFGILAGVLLAGYSVYLLPT